MKKIVFALAVAMIAASAVGCSTCNRLCPGLCGRGAFCGGSPLAAAPLAATPMQYMAPIAPVPASVATPCAAPGYTYWDPCQCAVVSQPTAGGQPAFAQPQPMVAAPMATSVVEQGCEPDCGYEPACGYEPDCSYEPDCCYAAEPGCGEPYMSDGPMMINGGCADCGSGGMSGVVTEGSVSPPPTQQFADPKPMNE